MKFGQTQANKPKISEDEKAYKKFKSQYDQKLKNSKNGHNIGPEQCEQMAKQLWNEFNEQQKNYFYTLKDAEFDSNSEEEDPKENAEIN